WRARQCPWASSRCAQAPCGGGWARRAFRSLAYSHQRGKRRRLNGFDAEEHGVMPFTAIFGALPPVDAGTVGFEPDGIEMARNSVDLAAQPRDPEGMDDILGRSDVVDRLASGNLHEGAVAHRSVGVSKLQGPAIGMGHDAHDG